MMMPSMSVKFAINIIEGGGSDLVGPKRAIHIFRLSQRMKVLRKAATLMLSEPRTMLPTAHLVSRLRKSLVEQDLVLSMSQSIRY